MRSLAGVVSFMLPALLVAGCSPHTRSEVASCTSSIDGGVSRITDVDVALTRASEEDGKVSLPLVIHAQIDCLVGGVTANVTTSIGTVNGAAPGSKAAVFLAPFGLDAGVLEGEAELVLPSGRTARIEVTVADSTFIDLIGAPDGGVGSGADDDDAGTGGDAGSD